MTDVAEDCGFSSVAVSSTQLQTPCRKGHDATDFCFMCPLPQSQATGIQPVLGCYIIGRNMPTGWPHMSLSQGIAHGSFVMLLGLAFYSEMSNL